MQISRKINKRIRERRRGINNSWKPSPQWVSMKIFVLGISFISFDVIIRWKGSSTRTLHLKISSGQLLSGTPCTAIVTEKRALKEKLIGFQKLPNHYFPLFLLTFISIRLNIFIFFCNNSRLMNSFLLKFKTDKK